MKTLSALLVATWSFALLSTTLVIIRYVIGIAPAVQTQGSSGLGYSLGTIAFNSSQSAFHVLIANSPALATSGWIMVGGVWLWRGKVKSRWQDLGLDSDTFDLFVRMRGAKTRSSLLGALMQPKDRMQLAQELGVDWKAVDYHIALLSKYGIVHEAHAYGKVKIYRLTKLGETLLELLKEYDVVQVNARILTT